MRFWCIIFMLLFPVQVYALDAVWDRNQEPDMAKYHVYVCRSAGCTATADGSLWIAEVAHPASGVEVSYGPLPDQTEGAVCVSAMDQSGNNSVCSVSVPFSTLLNLPPAAPANLRLR